MDRTAFMYSLGIVLCESLEIKKEREGGHTHYRSRLMLDRQDINCLIQMISQVCGCTPERALDILKEEYHKAFDKKMRTGIPGLIIAAVLVLFFLAFELIAKYFAFFSLAVVLGVSAAVVLTSRKREMKNRWIRRDAYGLDVYQAIERMTDVYGKSGFALTNKPLLGLLCICLLFSGLVIALPYLPAMTGMEAATRIKWAKNETDAAEIQAMFLDLKSDQLEKELERSYEYFSRTDDETIVVAAFANRFADSGMVSETFASDMSNRALSNLTNSRISDLPLQLFPEILPRVDEDVLMMFAETVTAQNERNELLCSFIGHFFAERKSTAELLELSSRLGGQVFLNDALGGEDIDTTISRLNETEDHAHQVAVAQAAAGGHTHPNDVLAFLKMAKVHGLKPTECYPNGAKLDWDLTYFALAKYIEEWKDAGKWLPVSISEFPEKLEYRTVPKEKHTLSADFTSIYEDDYEANNALGKAAYEVVLNTEWLEKIPEEKIPMNMNEVNSLLVFNTLYIREGTIRDTSYYQRADSTPNPLAGLSDIPGLDLPELPPYSLNDIEWQRHYPSYAVCQSIDLYDIETGYVNYRFRANIINTPEIPEGVRKRSSSSIYSIGGDIISKYYIATPDVRWTENARQEILQLMEDSNWDIDRAVMLDYLISVE